MSILKALILVKILRMRVYSQIFSALLLCLSSYCHAKTLCGLIETNVNFIADDKGQAFSEKDVYELRFNPPSVSVEFGVVRKADACPGAIAPNCNVPNGINQITVGAADSLVTRFAWTNSGLGDFDLINIVDQDGFQIANTGFNQMPGQTLVSAKTWVAPDVIGTHHWSQTLTITDQGGNVIDTTVNYVVIVTPPSVSVEFGVVRKADTCPGAIAPNCNVPNGINQITVGAADSLVTCLLYTSPSPRDATLSRMPSSA